jgi:hypothetical protein
MSLWPKPRRRAEHDVEAGLPLLPLGAPPAPSGPSAAPRVVELAVCNVTPAGAVPHPSGDLSGAQFFPFRGRGWPGEPPVLLVGVRAPEGAVGTADVFLRIAGSELPPWRVGSISLAAAAQETKYAMVPEARDPAVPVRHRWQRGMADSGLHCATASAGQRRWYPDWLPAPASFGDNDITRVCLGTCVFDGWGNLEAMCVVAHGAWRDTPGVTVTLETDRPE